MNDLQHASTLFLVFAAVLLAYSAALVKTGDKTLLPLRAQHSIRTKEDVRRVGIISARVSLVIAVGALIMRFVVA